MPLNRFLELAGTISKVKHEEAKQDLVNASFIAFQMGAGGDKTFGQYLETIGLAEKVETKEEASTADVIAKADRIREKVRKLKEKK